MAFFWLGSSLAQIAGDIDQVAAPAVEGLPKFAAAFIPFAVAFIVLSLVIGVVVFLLQILTGKTSD